MKTIFQLSDRELAAVVADMHRLVSDSTPEIASVAIAAQAGNPIAIARLAAIKQSLVQALIASVTQHQPCDPNRV